MLHLLNLSYFCYIRRDLLICLSVARNRGSDHSKAADHATGEAYATTFVAASLGPLVLQLETSGIIQENIDKELSDWKEYKETLDQVQGNFAEGGEEEEYHSPDGLVDPDGCAAPEDEPEQFTCNDLRRVGLLTRTMPTIGMNAIDPELAERFAWEMEENEMWAQQARGSSDAPPSSKRHKRERKDIVDSD